LIYSGGKVRGALQAAGLARDYAQSVLADVEGRVVSDIRKGFYDILLAGAVLSVRQESERILAAMLARAEEKRAKGAASDFESLTARVRLANAKPGLIEAQNGLELATENLRRLLNLDDSPFEIDGGLAVIPVASSLEELQTTAIEKRPVLQALEGMVRLREKEAAVSRGDGLPSLRLRAGYTGSDSYGYGPSQGDWEWHWNAGAVLTWNIWDGDRTRSRTASVLLEVEKAKTTLEDFRSTVRLEVRKAFLEMRRAELMVKAAEEAVGLAERALEIAKTRYDAGMSTQIEYSEANLNLSEARLARCSAMHSQMSSVTDLRRACGMPGAALEGRLER
jgi:outer membrane protein TolC